MSGIQASVIAAVILCAYLWAAVARALSVLRREPTSAERSHDRVTPVPAAPESRRSRSSGGHRAYRVARDRQSGEWILVPEPGP